MLDAKQHAAIIIQVNGKRSPTMKNETSNKGGARNWVAKHANSINRAATHKNKKHLAKNAYRQRKHKGGSQGDFIMAWFCFSC